MSKYPAIYKSEKGHLYLYIDKNNYYSFGRKEWNWGRGAYYHENDVNIAKEYLRNTKIRCESEEHSRFIQELVFNAGGRWVTRGIKVKDGKIPFLYINEDLEI